MASVVSDTSPGIRRRGRLSLVSGPAPAANSWRGRRATAPVWLSTVTVISWYGWRSGALAARSASSLAHGDAITAGQAQQLGARTRGQCCRRRLQHPPARRPADDQHPAAGNRRQTVAQQPADPVVIQSRRPRPRAGRAGPAQRRAACPAHWSRPRRRSSRTCGEPASSRPAVVRATWSAPMSMTVHVRPGCRSPMTLDSAAAERPAVTFGLVPAGRLQPGVEVLPQAGGDRSGPQRQVQQPATLRRSCAAVPAGRPQTGHLAVTGHRARPGR